MSNTSVLNVGELNAEQKRTAARLVISSVPEYYALFGRTGDALVASVVEQFQLNGSELNFGQALLERGEVVGLYCALMQNRLKSAQLLGLRKLVDTSDVARARLKQCLDRYSARVADLPSTDAWYLTRIAVLDRAKGTGIADQLMSMFLETAPQTYAASLHVAKSNTRAIRFYQRHGFAVQEVGNFDYLAMVRPAGAI